MTIRPNEILQYAWGNEWQAKEELRKFLTQHPIPSAHGIALVPALDYSHKDSIGRTRTVLPVFVHPKNDSENIRIINLKELEQ